MSEKYVKLDDIKTLLGNSEIHYDELEHWSCARNYIDKDRIENKIDNLPTIELPHWHDLRKNPEDLPPHNTVVLVVIGRFYDIAWRDNYDKFRLSRNNNIVSVTEWCEIPKESAK